MCTQNGAMDRCPKGVEFSGYPSWYGSAALCVCVRVCMHACVHYSQSIQCCIPQVEWSVTSSFKHYRTRTLQLSLINILIAYHRVVILQLFGTGLQTRSFMYVRLA